MRTGTEDGEIVMRSSIAFVFLIVIGTLVAAVSLPASAWAGRLEPALERHLLVSGPDEFVAVIIRPLGTLLGSALKRQVAAQYATRAEQHLRAVTALRATADATQPPILNALASSDFTGRVADVRNFWIDNVITARMTPSAIAELASRADVEEIILRPAVSWVEPLPVPDGMVPAEATGITQPGLHAIRADSLWQRGYTGKGRLVASIDTGVDGKHFLLSGKWRGHNGYSVRESWFNPQQDDTLPHIFSGTLAGHGTNVMGIMVAMDADASMDTLGVCFDAQWISAAAIDLLGTSIIEAMQWVADPDGDPNTEEDVPDAVNNSWGIPLLNSRGFYDSTGSCSDAFWNAIDNVEAAGAVMLFAAGNEGPHVASIRNPANRVTSETNAFSVGMVDASSETTPITVHRISSRGPSTCDMLSIKPEVVAPGVNIRTTNPNNNFTNYTLGTSFSVPHVAGGVALLREYNPNATVDTIKWALLHGARDMGAPGPDTAYGHGLLDLLGALRLMPANLSPALYIKRDLYTRPVPGDSTSMVIVLRSQGPAVSNVSVTLVSEDPRLTITNPSAAFGDFAAVGDTSGNFTDPFKFWVAVGPLPGERLPIRFNITGSGGYSRTVRGVVQVGPAQTEELFTHSAGNFQMTVSAYGTFGLEPDALAPRTGGKGYFYGSDPTQSLFEGAFLVGIDSDHVSDNARNTLGFPDDDFQLDPGGRLDVQIPGTDYTEETRAAFSDAYAEHPIGLFIEQRTLVDSSSSEANYLIAEYTIHNRSGSTIHSLRAGLYFDWDFPWSPDDTSQAQSDSGGYDVSAGAGWMNERGQKRYRGLTVLTPPGTTSYGYFDNNPDIYDGFTESEKWLAMAGGLGNVGPEAAGDGSNLIATGPLAIPADGFVTVAFAIIGDTTESGMLASAAHARIRYAGNALVVYPGSLSFAAQVGGSNPAEANLTLTNGTPAAVSYTVEHYPDWAPVAPTSGSIASGTSATLEVTPSLGTLHAGTYRDTILITTSDVEEDSIEIPVTFTVSPKEVTGITPNPFNPNEELVQMAFTLASQMRIHATVYDLTGQKVRVLTNDVMLAGDQEIAWDGKSGGGRIAADGVYLCHVEGDGGFKKTFTIVLKR
jgi:bacillopeptidase F